MHNDTSTDMLPLNVQSLNYSVSDKALLQDITLKITTSGITALLGHNGAGKSLLLRVLHGLLPPTTGTVRWHSRSVTELDVRKKQAMVFQKPVVLRRSVAANIDYVLSRNCPVCDLSR